VLRTGSVLTSEAGKTIHAEQPELDAGEQLVCEDSRINVSSGDTTAAVDGSNNGQCDDACSDFKTVCW